jgi:hypothetical protein
VVNFFRSDTLILPYVIGLSSVENEKNFSAILAVGPPGLPFWQSPKIQKRNPKITLAEFRTVLISRITTFVRQIAIHASTIRTRVFITDYFLDMFNG